MPPEITIGVDLQMIVVMMVQKMQRGRDPLPTWQVVEHVLDLEVMVV